MALIRAGGWQARAPEAAHSPKSGRTLPAVAFCRRCANEGGPERFCAVCGADQMPDEPRLPTAESHDAAMRELAWFGEYPEMRAELEAEQESSAPPPPPPDLSGVRPLRFGEYTDLRLRELAARALIVATLGLALVSALFEVIHIGIVRDIGDGSLEDFSTWDASNARLGFAYIATFVAYLLAAIPFIAWLVRARRNVEALGVYDLAWSKGWAIGGWFVPILSLWRPKQVVNEIWRASDPDLPHGAREAQWSRIPLSWVVGWWWGLFIAGGILDRISGRMYAGATTAPAELSATYAALISSLLTAAAAVLAIQLMRQLTRRQRARAERIGQLPERPSETKAHAAPAPAGAA
jgi:hypothetical protein